MDEYFDEIATELLLTQDHLDDVTSPHDAWLAYEHLLVTEFLKALDQNDYNSVLANMEELRDRTYVINKVLASMVLTAKMGEKFGLKKAYDEYPVRGL